MRVMSPAPDIAAVDRVAERRAAACPQERAECVAADGVAQKAACDRADHEAGRAVAAAAIIAAVAAAIDAVIPTQSPFAIMAAMMPR